MLLRLLTLPISGPLEGVTWLGKKLQEQVDTEIDETENLSKKLLTLQLAFDMGEISEEDFEAQEEELLLAIQALEEQKLKEEEEDA
ncbi:MAG: gas vesicle protein GvpG [Trichodesmium sp. St16_bin4-tuft]|nr:gas vesicle protein GvpG [Trichodesmium sp. MAG_R01]MDE5069040.1 gas vesicle protein GvpG [Trichodesmium sp. St4_bin8_1]MDE5072027.1 gas vesicle protein GvpG [Trichodesmium sp. St5_bin8]MDE5079225.1 gas vesicle protein GvpG [Trichodesmium sp. St2_bin6]MDE5090966.1 gas vesicle protein GvpG [Trichodesmium sp. St18_bin3_1_1]MDE5096870.1 gas vesicle protein GvpG [Trichodesmium sp. St16_bin4-tuft]MDE5104305.1 gas vesicle protein GvpG [Trichodesmium sp. St19_bin2]